MSSLWPGETIDKEVSVTFLGTGVPLPGSPFRSSSSIIISVGGECLVFDSGRGVVQQAYHAGIPLAELNRVFLTHHHYDHIGDLGDLGITSWLAGRNKTFEVYGPLGTGNIVSALFEQVFSLDIEFRNLGEPTLGGWPPVSARELTPESEICGNEYRVIAGEVDHWPGVSIPGFEDRWQCFGYRVETPAGIVAISGDGVPSEGMSRICSNADVLILCCYLAPSEINSDYRRMLANSTLLSADRAGLFARDVGAKRVILTHTRPKSPELISEMVAAVSEDFGAQVEVAQDLMTVAI